MGRAAQAWDCYDIYTDLECSLNVKELATEPSCYDGDGKLIWIRRDTLLWEVLQEYFVREFDVDATMEALCASYGIENLYAKED